jgi:hypothetical protein
MLLKCRIGHGSRLADSRRAPRAFGLGTRAGRCGVRRRSAAASVVASHTRWLSWCFRFPRIAHQGCQNQSSRFRGVIRLPKWPYYQSCAFGVVCLRESRVKR